MDIVGPFTLIVGDYPDTDVDLDTPIIRGVITDVVLKHTFDGGSAMDIDIATTGDSMPSEDILGLSGSSTDGRFSPRSATCGTDGTPIADLYTAGISVYDTVNIAISNAGAGDRLDVWFLVNDE